MRPSTLSERVAILEAQVAAMAIIIGGLRDDLPETVTLKEYAVTSDGRMMRATREFAAINGLRVDDLRGSSQAKEIAHARQDLMAILHSRKHSSTQIGRFLGGRDHSTILHGIRVSKARNAVNNT